MNKLTTTTPVRIFDTPEVQDFLNTVAGFDKSGRAIRALSEIFGFVEIGQLIRKLVRFLMRQLERVAPPRVSGVVAVLLVVAVQHLTVVFLVVVFLVVLLVLLVEVLHLKLARYRFLVNIQ